MFALAVAGSGVGLAAGMSNTTGNAPTTQVVPNATAMAQGAQVAAPNQQANRVPISGSQKEEVQQELKRAGLYRGDVDGIFGPETRRAIAEFQRQHGLSQTGNARPTDLDRPQSYEQCERL
jgi:peptidoglycan hydrolase-like protein with peptidoglycan-binding domain